MQRLIVGILVVLGVIPVLALEPLLDGDIDLGTYSLLSGASLAIAIGLIFVHVKCYMRH